MVLAVMLWVTMFPCDTGSGPAALLALPLAERSIIASTASAVVGEASSVFFRSPIMQLKMLRELGESVVSGTIQDWGRVLFTELAANFCSSSPLLGAVVITDGSVFPPHS